MTRVLTRARLRALIRAGHVAPGGAPRYTAHVHHAGRALLVLALAVACAAPTPDDRAGDGKARAAGDGAKGRVDPTAGEATPPGFFERRGVVVVQTAAGPLRFPVELALSDGERQRGLMFRERLDDDSGMLFVFERAKVQSFWMKNTRLPLDMIFIGEDGAIAGIVENAEPLTTVSRRVERPSRYVLELVAGSARARGLAAGQRVTFEGVPRELVGPALLAAPPPTPGSTP